MSALSDSVHALIVEAFPFTRVLAEYYVEYKSQRLFVDFFLPSYSIAIEVHGQQHDKFVRHFHGDYDGWCNHKRRDQVKIAWAEAHGITLVVIRENELPKDKNELLDIIQRFCND